jgi:hypothetical protein
MGGIVRARPGGRLVMVGEGGSDEAIVPLNGRSGLGGSVTVNINARGAIFRDRNAMREFGEEILPYIAKAAQTFQLTR